MRGNGCWQSYPIKSRCVFGEVPDLRGESCDLFAQIVGAKSGLAVQQQIRFAIQLANSGSAKWKAPQSQTVIMCKAAALEMGFIGSADLPDLHAKHHGVTAVALDDPAELESAIDLSR